MINKLLKKIKVFGLTNRKVFFQNGNNVVVIDGDFLMK
jgi:hypothetical protein